MTRRTPLSRERIITAAAAVADRTGVAAVSMRSVAKVLGVEAMSLYHHVPSKEALLDDLADWVFERIELPEVGDTWQEALTVTALRVGDVDFERGIIHVSRSLSPGQHGELIEQSPKSHRSRDVPLIDALRPYAETAARGKQANNLLLAGVDGGRLTNHNAPRGVDWETLREAIGRPDLRIHDLRHTFATILFDAGASAPDVQATLGHSSLQVTERYSRAREGVALRTGAVLNDALNNAAVEPSQRTRTAGLRRP